ncbi:unnamed protein product [Lymnaea stagnalis]|uniref:Ig-like domain-containing protein n=1 Tax=Lymnaea stagnalis TaxID=6523 RepID=A0AAV2H1P0_LYMST
MTPPLACLVLVVMAGASRTVSPPPVWPFNSDAGLVDDEGSVRSNQDGEEIGGYAVHVCPKLCVCYERAYLRTNIAKQLTTVNCSDRGLLDFPGELPNKTEVFDLSHNKLQNMSSLPYLPELRVLDLSNNWIRQLDNHWLFEHVSKLRILSLADNALTVLQHGTFSGLSDLRELDMSRNIIKRLELHSFSGLTNLEVLRLDRNQLYQVKREWFLPLTSLQSLYMSNNFVSTLDKDMFDKLGRLQQLDLSLNALQEVKDGSFTGLVRLKMLNLTGNSNLREVPSAALKSLTALNILLLDGISVQRLQPFCVTSLAVVEMSLSYLPKLRVVEQSAFHNLSNLMTLQLHDNPRLIYLHPSAFSSLPHLRHLLLHNNGLVAVPGQIMTSLPSLTDLHLHHNPFHCDCNIYWLRKELSFEYHFNYKSNNLTGQKPQSTPTSSITSDTSTLPYTTFAPPTSTSITGPFISEPDRVSCFFPAGSSSMSLVQLPMQYFSETCPPTAIALFSALVNVSVGEELWLECQGLGVPVPLVSWVLPDGRELNASSTMSEQDTDTVKVIGDTLLHIQSVTTSDGGTYGCHVVNSLGQDFRTTLVRVQNKPLTLSDVKVGNDYITVAWKGSIPRIQMSEFQLRYKEVALDTNKDMTNQEDGPKSQSRGFDVINLHGSIHKCTITGLKPLTTYEVCLMYKQIHRVQCNNYTTSQDVQVMKADGIVRISKTQLGVGLAAALGVVLLAVVTLLVRKVRHRKDYKDPLADEEKASIPLEAMAPTAPSTPLTSSRTALLTHSQI